MNSFRTVLFSFLIIFLSFPILSLADSLELKSGKVIEGQIVEQNPDMVKIDAGVGVTVTYYRDEIEKVNDQPFLSPIASEQNVTEEPPQATIPAEIEDEGMIPLPSIPEALVEPVQENLPETETIISDSPSSALNSEKPTLELKPDEPTPVAEEEIPVELTSDEPAPVAVEENPVDVTPDATSPVEKEVIPVAEETPQPAASPPLTNPEQIEILPEKKETPAPVVTRPVKSSASDKYFPKELKFLQDFLTVAFQRKGSERIVVSFITTYLLIIALFVAGFVIHAAAFFKIGGRLSDPTPAHAFIPVIQWFLLMRLAGWPAVLVLLMFIPFVSDFVQIFAWMKINRRLNRSELWGILMPVWVLNLIVIWMLALSPAPQKVEKILPEDLKS